MEIFIDFGGFYESIHSQSIDWRIETDQEYYLENIEEATNDIFDSVDWKATHFNYGQAYVDMINNELDLDLRFNGINSPKYYNFTTDKIKAYLSRENQVNLYNEYSYKNEFIEWAKPHFTARDGYIPYYESLDALILLAMDNDRDMEVLIGTIIDWLIEYNKLNDDIYDLDYEVQYTKELEQW